MVSVRNPRGFVVQIDLPDRDLMPAEVADVADTYLRLQDERNDARAKVRQLEAEARTAQRTRRHEHADALISGTKPPADNNSTADALDRAKADADAYDLAYEQAAQHLADTIEAHRPDWAEHLATHIDSLRDEIRQAVETAADAWWRYEHLHRITGWLHRFPHKPKLTVKPRMPDAAPILSEMLAILDPPEPEPEHVTVEGDDE